MSDDRKRILPPVYFLAALIAMIVLHFVVPLLVVIEPIAWLGVPLIVGGFCVVLWGAKLFGRAGTPIKPFEESTVLVTRGPFRVSRNPIYLAMAVTLAGVWLTLGTLSPALVVPVFLAAIHSQFVLREEAMLLRTFGAEYEEYRRRVRRWI